jgi:hypothetical protein
VAKLFWTAVFASVAFCPALTQDAAKVEPKHYKLAFENDKVEVLYVHYGAHEKSKMHSHLQGVVVALTESHLRFTDQDGKTQEVYSKPGEARWHPAVRHTVENLGKTDYSGVYIGVKETASARGGTNSGPELDKQTATIVAAYVAAARSAQDTKPASPQ